LLAFVSETGSCSRELCRADEDISEGLDESEFKRIEFNINLNKNLPAIEKNKHPNEARTSVLIISSEIIKAKKKKNKKPVKPDK